MVYAYFNFGQHLYCAPMLYVPGAFCLPSWPWSYWNSNWSLPDETLQVYGLWSHSLDTVSACMCMHMWSNFVSDLIRFVHSVAVQLWECTCWVPSVVNTALWSVTRSQILNVCVCPYVHVCIDYSITSCVTLCGLGTQIRGCCMYMCLSVGSRICRPGSIIGPQQHYLEGYVS